MVCLAMLRSAGSIEDGVHLPVRCSVWVGTTPAAGWEHCESTGPFLCSHELLTLGSFSPVPRVPFRRRPSHRRVQTRLGCARRSLGVTRPASVSHCCHLGWCSRLLCRFSLRTCRRPRCSTRTLRKRILTAFA